MVIDQQSAATLAFLVLTVLMGIIGWFITREIRRNDQTIADLQERVAALEKCQKEFPASVKFPQQGGA